MILAFGYTFTPDDVETALADATHGELISIPWPEAFAEALDHLASLAPDATAADVETARRIGLSALADKALARKTNNT